MSFLGFMQTFPNLRDVLPDFANDNDISVSIPGLAMLEFDAFV